ncbi:NADH-quinone oxidoreductase subunit J [Candidatus Pyrohabitans sp.]
MMDSLVFFIISAIVIAGALGVVMAERIFHAVLALALALLGVAGIFITLGAEFLAAIQVLVYAGGVVVLFLFATMLTKSDLQLRRLPSGDELAPVSAVLFAIVALFYVASTGFFPLGERASVIGSVQGVGELIFNPQVYAIPFELVGLLLLAAMVGAIFLAKKEDAK